MSRPSLRIQGFSLNLLRCLIQPPARPQAGRSKAPKPYTRQPVPSELQHENPSTVISALGFKELSRSFCIKTNPPQDGTACPMLLLQVSRVARLDRLMCCCCLYSVRLREPFVPELRHPVQPAQARDLAADG